MELGEKINLIQHNFEIGAYTIVAKECVGLIEQAFRQLFNQRLTQLDEKDRLKVQKAELEVGKGEKGIESFTMGQLVGVFRKSHFLEAWAHASGKELSSIRMINLDELNSLRNKLIHEGEDVSRSKAEFLMNCLQVILEAFDLINPADAQQIFSLNTDQQGFVELHRNPPFSQHMATPVSVAELVPETGIQTLVIESGFRVFLRKLASYRYLLQAFALGLIVFVLLSIPYLQLIELKALDWKFKAKHWYHSYKNSGQIHVKKEQIVIVALDDEFMEGDMISRPRLSAFLQRLSVKSPKVIGLDVLLDTRKDGDAELLNSIQAAGNVVIPFELKAAKPQTGLTIISPLPEFQESTQMGFANFSENPFDGIVRELRPLTITEGERIYYPFSLQILRAFHSGKALKDILRDNPEKDNSLRINFKAEDQFLIMKPEDIEHGAFKDFYYADKIVLVGYLGEKQEHDQFLTPLSVGNKKMRGVLVQANIVHTINAEQYLRSWTSLNMITVLLFASIGANLFPQFGWITKLLILPAIWILYSVLVFCLFLVRIDIPLWSPILTLTLTTFFMINRLSQ